MHIVQTSIRPCQKPVRAQMNELEVWQMTERSIQLVYKKKVKTIPQPIFEKLLNLLMQITWVMYLREEEQNYLKTNFREIQIQ